MIGSPLGLCCCASACAAGNTEVAAGIDGNTWVVVGIAGDIGFVVLVVGVGVVVVVAAVEAPTVRQRSVAGICPPLPYTRQSVATGTGTLGDGLWHWFPVYHSPVSFVYVEDSYW